MTKRLTNFRQFSTESSWFEQSVKVAWTVEESPKEVIIKKCPREIKKNRLTRHSSLEKDSILNTKQEPKPNLDIYLSHNPEPSPRLKPPLLNNPNLKPKKLLDKEPKKPNTIVVVPLKTSPREEPIQVVITAQTKRENFQKRTNSAFNGTTKPPLIRSSSAPSIKVKPKFLATKRKLKSGKKAPVAQKLEPTEWCASSSEIETMVSLVSPSGSEVDSDDEVVGETRPKSALKDEGKIRKTLKSVTFQPSSIHAVRSFSASFPARRNSIMTALGKEKRATSSTSNETQERVPKRKLLRSNTGAEPFKLYRGPEEAAEPTKPKNQEQTFEDEIRLDFQEKVTVILPLEPKQPEQICETVKEKQCWDMYRKMAERGVNVSYDTILRGLLTPTEYRVRRTTSIAEEMNLLLNPPVENCDKPAEATTKAETC